MAHRMAFLLSIFFWCSVAHAQLASGTDPSNYVVIGAFSVEQNAKHFVTKAKSNSYSAVLEFNPARELYYVYVMNTLNKTEAISEAKKLQKQSPYWDTWVFTGHLGKDAPLASSNGSSGEDIDPVEGNTRDVEAMDLTATPAQQEAPTTVEAEPDPVQASQEEEPLAIEEGTKPFKFIVTSAAKGNEIAGEVNMVDPSNSRKLGSYPANEIVGIRPPLREGSVNFECEIFGYRKAAHSIDYNNPSATEGVKIGERNEIMVPFELVRLAKGDKSIMYNVYFFKDAAIMRPESRTEVNSLTDMMKENPDYHIRIHGHTNGGGAGKIVELGDDKNFFSLNGSKEGYGSSKKLSQVRAETIKEYLMAQGIDEGRMDIKAWGGKRGLVDKHHPQAQANVRVEIEIIKD